MNKTIKIILTIFIIIVVAVVGFIAINITMQVLSRSPMYEIKNIQSNYLVVESVKSPLPTFETNKPYIVNNGEKIALDTKGVYTGTYDQPIYDYATNSYVVNKDLCALVFYNKEGQRTDIDVCEVNEEIDNLSIVSYSVSTDYLVIYGGHKIYVTDREGNLLSTITVADDFGLTDMYVLDGKLFYLLDPVYEGDDPKFDRSSNIYKYDINTEDNLMIYESSENETIEFIKGNNSFIISSILLSYDYSTFNYYVGKSDMTNLDSDPDLTSNVSSLYMYYDNDTNYLTLQDETDIITYVVTDTLAESATIDFKNEYTHNVYSPKNLYISTNTNFDEMSQYDMNGNIVNEYTTNYSDLNGNVYVEAFVYDLEE